MLAILNGTFDPVLLSLEENAFLLEHLGKPPAVVARVPLPHGVNAKAIMPVVEQVYSLCEIEKHDHQAWTGVEPLKAQIRIYLEQHRYWGDLKARSGDPEFPRFPSMSGWDVRGKAHPGAVGSDAGRVRTYFDEAGQRQPFAVPLHGPATPQFVPPWVKTGKSYDAIVVDDTHGTLTCPICQERETWDVQSQAAKNAANARMAKHLVSAKKEPDAHKALHTRVYAS